MRKTLFMKKMIAVSLCVSLLLPIGTAAEETVRETNEAAMTEESAGEMQEKEPASESTEEKSTSVGYALERLAFYNDDKVTMDMDSLKAELDFASEKGVSGVRMLIDSGGTKAGYIAASYKDGMILIVLHGGLSEQTVKYKIDSETLTTILDSNAFNLFLRGTSDSILEEQESAGSESEEPESVETEQETAGSEPEEPESVETETAGSEPEESEGAETEQETAGSEPEEPETVEAEQESAGNELEETERETDRADFEEDSDELTINGLSLTGFVRLINEAYLLISEGAVRNEEVESDQGTFHRSGIVLNREHMERLLEICYELGIDGGVKKRLEKQNIQPEGGALLWGTDDKDYRAVAGSFGVSVGEEAPVWNAFGADIVGRELTIYNYRMPEQQTMEMESGVEIVFGMVDPEDGASWVPVDDKDAIDLAKLEPAEAIEKVSTDVQMVLYDMMGGVLTAVLEELPEEMVTDMLGLETEEEEMSEPES